MPIISLPNLAVSFQKRPSVLARICMHPKSRPGRIIELEKDITVQLAREGIAANVRRKKPASCVDSLQQLHSHYRALCLWSFLPAKSLDV